MILLLYHFLLSVIYRNPRGGHEPDSSSSRHGHLFCVVKLIGNDLAIFFLPLVFGWFCRRDSESSSKQLFSV